jgi:MFS family permease
LTQRERATPPLWIFGVAAMPYGAFNGVVAVALPYLLRQRGASVERIAAIEALVQAPAIWYVLWAPIVDFGLRRRTWIVLLGLASGLCTGVALSLTSDSLLRSMTVLLVAASAFGQPVSSALGALVASVIPNARRGLAAGWSQAGILSAGVLAGGLAVWLSGHARVLVTGIAVGVVIAAPALAALAVSESQPGGAWRTHLGQMRRELTATIRRRDVWFGFLFFLSPAGAGALMNLFSGVAPDFHASSADVIAVAAVGGLMMTAGALAGGFVLDRMNRWRMYAIAGLLCGASGAGIAVAPLRPVTYLVGAAAYAFCTGVAYAAFMALALELLGTTEVASGTRFTLFTAAVNVPVVYMLRVDGLAHAHFGVRGMLASDSLANAVFGCFLLLLLAYRSRSRAASSKLGSSPAVAKPERARTIV